MGEEGQTKYLDFSGSLHSKKTDSNFIVKEKKKSIVHKIFIFLFFCFEKNYNFIMMLFILPNFAVLFTPCTKDIARKENFLPG